MMFRKFTTINGQEIYLNVDNIEMIRDYHAVRPTAENEDEKYSMIFIRTEQPSKAYVVKGEAESIVLGIYNSRRRWTSNG